MSSLLEETVQRLLATLEWDCQDYQRLASLLEAQFKAALALQAQTMSELAQDIAETVDGIDARRPVRDAVLAQLLGRRASPSLNVLAQRLPASLPVELRERFDAACRQINERARECKQLNLRNCELIHEQHVLMQRLLGKPEHGYA